MQKDLWKTVLYQTVAPRGTWLTQQSSIERTASPRENTAPTTEKSGREEEKKVRLLRSNKRIPATSFTLKT
jgi:hypothetical protein